MEHVSIFMFSLKKPFKPKVHNARDIWKILKIIFN